MSASELSAQIKENEARLLQAQQNRNYVQLERVFRRII